MFKKKKIKSIKNNKYIINIISIIVIFIVFIFGFLALSYAKKNTIGTSNKTENNKFSKKENIIENNKNKLDNDNYLQEKKENIKKNEDKINFLLLGRGGKLNDAPNLTDSIILASINKKTKTISMFSIPRDLYVKYKNGKYGRINKIYALERHKTGSEKAGVDALKYNVELITGEKIDYYINVDFLGFINFIDAIGGIRITVPKKLIDYKFPDNNWGYTTFVIRKGTWLFDGETALKYARSRHSTSDFDRSIRQQQILKAIKEKLLEGNLIDKIDKIDKIYALLKKYVKTDIDFKGIINLFTELKDNKYIFLSSNLNDSCFGDNNSCKKGGFLYIPERKLFGGASVLLVKGSRIGKINNYGILKEYVNIIFNYPLIFKESINISILNGTNKPKIATKFAEIMRKYGFNIPKNYISSITTKYIKNTTINYKTSINNTQTIFFLKKIFKNAKFNEVKALKYTKQKNAEIEILIGDNYNKVFKNNFKIK